MQVTSGIQCNLLSPSYSTIYAPQGDAKSRFVLIQLLEGAAPWEVPAGASVIIRAAKPDGTICFYDTNEAGESAYTISGSTVTIELVGQVLAAPGPVLMQIDFYNTAGAHLSTFTFCCQVSESVVADDDIVSSNYFSVLTATLTEMLQIEQAVKAAYGAPLVAATAAAMTDHTRVYVYTGSESGYTNGNWYYWNGTAWASGGVYNSSAVNVDSAPTQGSTNPVSSGGTYTAIANEAAAREAADTALGNELDDVKSALNDVKELVADVDTHQETATETTTPTWAQGYTAPDGSVGSSTTLYYCTPINISEGDVIQPTRGDEGLIASVYYLTAYYNNSAVSALGGNNVSMPYTVPSGVDKIVLTIASVYLNYGTPKIKRTYIYNAETIDPKFVDKSGVGQVEAQNIKGMTEIGAGISPNLFPKATLLESGKYVGGINSSTGKVDLYTNASYDTYILPVDGESVYSFTYVRFGCVVADIALTAVGNLLSDITQIDSTGGNYILFSFSPSVNLPSYYVITNNITYYEVPNNWVYRTTKSPKDSTNGAIVSDGSLVITGRSALKDGEVITFKGFFESFNGFTLNFYAMAVTNFITVTASTITIKSTTITPSAIIHGLTIENYVSLECQFINGKLKITLYSNDGSFTTTVDWNQINGEVSQPQIISNGTAFTNAILSASYDATKRDVWYFGDSYVSVLDPARWTYYLKEDGFLQNILLNGASGGSSNGSIISFNTLLKYGTPKIAVFATGMNDGSDSSSAPPTAYVNRRKEFLTLCEMNKIEPVFCTIPTVPTVNNEQKNAWVRASGYRYIDFAKAVGADENGVWYSGMLSSDNVHPSVTGAKALYSQVLVDLPEVAVS